MFFETFGALVNLIISLCITRSLQSIDLCAFTIYYKYYILDKINKVWNTYKYIAMKEQAEKHMPRLMLTSSSGPATFCLFFLTDSSTKQKRIIRTISSLMEEQSVVLESEAGSVCPGSFYTASGAGGTEENGGGSCGLFSISGTKGGAK